MSVWPASLPPPEAVAKRFIELGITPEVGGYIRLNDDLGVEGACAVGLLLYDRFALNAFVLDHTYFPCPDPGFEAKLFPDLPKDFTTAIVCGFDHEELNAPPTATFTVGYLYGSEIRKACGLDEPA